MKKEIQNVTRKVKKSTRKSVSRSWAGGGGGERIVDLGERRVTLGTFRCFFRYYPGAFSIRFRRQAENSVYFRQCCTTGSSAERPFNGSGSQYTSQGNTSRNVNARFAFAIFRTREISARREAASRAVDKCVIGQTLETHLARNLC